MHDMDFRITDISGEQYYFKEAALALSRTLRQRKEEFDIWHPAECTGEAGAAVGRGGHRAGRRGLPQGLCATGRNILAHLANDAGQRAAVVAAVPGRGMSNQVYANSMEVSCKQAAGKSICAFPDVCFTPPQTPATPPGVPIPYPNTGMASDTTDGSTTVKISGEEVMLKNKCYFKKSTGRRGRLRAEEGRGDQQEHGQGVLHRLVDGREGRRRERRAHDGHDDAQPRVSCLATRRHGRIPMRWRRRMSDVLHLLARPKK